MTTVGPASRTSIAALICEASEGHAWLLTTRATSYVVAVDEAGTLAQHYWGPAVPPSAFGEVLEPERGRWNSSFQRPAEIAEQLPVDGGPHWAVPSLQVRFRGGVRSIQLEFSSATINAACASEELRIVLADTARRFKVTLHYRVRRTTDVIERWVTVANDHPHDAVTVIRADSGNWLIPDQCEYRISSSHGHWGAETQLERRLLPTGEHTLTSRQGTTGHGANPWVMIDAGEATEDTGDVRSIALAWSGSWRLTTQRRPEGTVSVTGGFGHDGLEWQLPPGQTLTTPATLGLFTTGGFGAASRAWHSYLREHVLAHGGEQRPVLYNSWEATSFDVTEEGQSRLARSAAAIGIELFVMDDGWFGGRRDDTAGLGDWHPSPEGFPHGLSGLISTVHSLGMWFGIWVEPEMVNPDSELYRLHPDWVLHWPGRTRTERRHQLVLNFARLDVRRWAVQWLRDLVGSNGVDFLKWDMNRPFTEAGWPDNPDNQDLLWIEHTRGVYQVMDAVRSAHPGLRIEACAGGGARADIGVLAHTDQIWTSDNTDALDRQVIQEGFSQIYPVITMGAWVTDDANLLTGRAVPLDYRFHVAMAGNLGIGADLSKWSEEDLERAREHISAYKRVRSTIQQGDQYRLGGRPGRDWSAIEYVDAAAAVIFAYEPHRSLSTAPRRLPLRGLDPDATYRDEATGDVHNGALLLYRGIRFNAGANAQGVNNSRFSTEDYTSSMTVLRKLSVS